jgi:hypothetical protein
LTHSGGGGERRQLDIVLAPHLAFIYARRGDVKMRLYGQFERAVYDHLKTA